MKTKKKERDFWSWRFGFGIAVVNACILYLYDLSYFLGFIAVNACILFEIKKTKKER